MRAFKTSIIFLAFLVAGIFLVWNQGEVIRAFDVAREFAASSFDSDVSRERVVFLESENERLRSELAALGKPRPDHDPRYKAADVYSRYPLNDKSVLIVSLGFEDGISEGMPVFLPSGALIGKVKNVRGIQSEVMMIFDAAWRSSVEIGENGTKAVLRGGSFPDIELIAREALVKEGDRVINIAPEFPLSSHIGTLVEVKKTAQDVWQSGKLRVPYELPDIKTVLILTNFP